MCLFKCSGHDAFYIQTESVIIVKFAKLTSDVRVFHTVITVFIMSAITTTIATAFAPTIFIDISIMINFQGILLRDRSQLH